MSEPLIQVSALVPAAPEAVVDLLLDRVAEPAQERGGEVSIDRNRHQVVVWGEWWYRGGYTVDPDPAGSRITHQVDNAAREARWAVPLANRLFIGFHRRTEESFAALVDGIGEEAARLPY